MILTIARLLLIAASITAIVSGLYGMKVPLTRITLPESATRVVAGSDIPNPDPDSLVNFVVRHSPFRPQRRPATLAVNAKAMRPPPAQPRPTLLLSGLVWGNDPSAVIVGLPGVEGSRVVRRGDLVAGIRVKRIDRDRVWLSGWDTTWALALQQAGR